MQSTIVPSISLALGVAAFVLVVRRYLTRHSIQHIRGPPSSSWLFGHSLILTRQVQVGDHEFQYMNKYGNVWRTKECFGRDALTVIDPKALQHIFHKAGYLYTKSSIARTINRCTTGESILCTGAEDHQRQRKILNHGFSASQIRSFLPIFHRHASKLDRIWREELALQVSTSASDNSLVTNVYSWLSKLTLDAIGEAAFDFQFNALEESSGEMMQAYRDIFTASRSSYPSKSSTLIGALLTRLPETAMSYLPSLPIRPFRQFRASLTTINEVSKGLIKEKTEACLLGKEEKKDIMSILVNANASEDPKSRLSEQEMIAQIAAFLLAGHETTANSLSWILWELAKHPDYQHKMRLEILALRDARGNSEFSTSDLDSMTYTTAAIKETMRFHPVLHIMDREAGQDDVLPLGEPVVSITGELVSSIPINEGQHILVLIGAYHRLTSVWGEDADVWNPQRFMGDNIKVQQVHIGLYANLFGFSGGARGCIGWRFAVLEMQIVLIHLLATFEFALPDDKPEILRVPASFMVPMIKDKMHLGVQMPLKITLVQ